MKPRKVDEDDAIQFWLAAQRGFSAVEASKVVSGEEGAPAHDAHTRLLQRSPPDSEALWQEVETLVMMLTSHWPGKHHAVVSGINLISRLWMDGQAHVPCAFRFYNPDAERLTKNDHWLRQLKRNRLLSIDRSGNRPSSEGLSPSQGQKMPLNGRGWVKVFKTVATDGTFEYWATSRLDMTLDAWQSEVYRRGLKQNTGIERGPFRLLVAQKYPIALAIRAFVRLEAYRLNTGIPWFEAQQPIIRHAIRSYLNYPPLILNSTE